ncbi:MAG TPA: tetratricopeptide repeat protein [Chthoniobacterales bacterium]
MNLLLRIQRYSPGPAAYLFGAVFLLRVFALARLTSSPFLLPARGDMHFYNDWAQRILSGQFTDHLAFYGLPLYAYGLALLYKVFGSSPFVPGLLQALLEAGTAALTYTIAQRVLLTSQDAPAPRLGKLTPWVALLAGLACGFCVPAQAYAVILMPTVWLIFVFWFVVWRIVRTDQAPGTTEYFVLGILLGVTAMGVATILFLAPLLLAAACKASPSRKSLSRMATSAALLFCGIIAGTSPCWIHNYFIARDPVFLSAHGGINFWIGNNPDANGYPRFPPGLHAGQAAMLQDSINAAESAAGHPLKRAEVSEFWSRKARSYIASHPLDWLKLLLTKLRNFWSAFRYDDLSIVTDLREHRVILPGISFGLIAAFGLPGMLLGWRRSPASRWVTAAILLHMAALMPVFVTERYRLPIVPGLLVCALLGLVMFWQSLVQARYSQSAIYLTLLGLAVAFVSWPQGNPALWALDSYNSGIQSLELGRESLDRRQPDAAAAEFATANSKLEKAFAYVPDNAELNFALGELHQVQGQTTEAKSFYAAALQSDPRHDRAFNNLGLLALDEQRYSLAESFFRRSLEVDSKNAKTHFLLAKTLLAAGQREPAVREAELAVALSPGQREFRALRDQMTGLVSP